MQPHAAELRHIERQVVYARPIFLVMALVDLLEVEPSAHPHRAIWFVAVYLGAALAKSHRKDAGICFPSHV